MRCFIIVVSKSLTTERAQGDEKKIDAWPRQALAKVDLLDCLGRGGGMDQHTMQYKDIYIALSR